MRFLLFFLFTLASVKLNAQYADTIHIYYRTGAFLLEKGSEQLLDSLISSAKPQKMLIYSYTDGTGSEKRNQDLSIKRAENVKDYLIKHSPGSIIPVCEGMGEDKSGSSVANNATSRRTDIFIPGGSKPAAVAPLSKMKIRDLGVNQALRLDNIIFFPGSPDVLPGSENELRRLLDLMNDNPDLEIRLEGHVCCSVAPDGYKEGTPSWILSQERAGTVLKYLVDNGISNKRVSYMGFGRTKPIFKAERTPEEQSANRRVEVRILKK